MGLEILALEGKPGEACQLSFQNRPQGMQRFDNEWLLSPATLGGPVQGSYPRQPLPGASRPVSKGRPPVAMLLGAICCCPQRGAHESASFSSRLGAQGRCSQAAMELSLARCTQPRQTPARPPRPLPRRAAVRAAVQQTQAAAAPPRAEHKPSPAKVTAENQLCRRAGTRPS